MIRKLLNVSLLLTLAVVSVMALPVSKERAQTVAENFLNCKMEMTEGNVALRRMPALQSAANADAECIYVFSRADGNGGVIVAADDCASPILGYTDSPLPSADEALPRNIQTWLDFYTRQINYAREHNLSQSAEVAAQWQSLARAKSPTARVIVAPLIATRWDQMGPYNALTPENTPTGCVATAMAQIMKYWEYPTQGNGSRSYKTDDYGRLSADFENTTYEWDNMPAYITESSASKEKTAIATLMYHCGVSTRMSYGTEGSGTYVLENYSKRGDDCAEYALKTYFGYKDSMRGELRDYKSEDGELTDIAFTDEEWRELIREELMAGRPVLYAGFGEDGGHAFVCDGYDDNNYFHFNWGWSGAYDGWFSLNALNLSAVGTGGGNGDFNTLQQVLLGLEPDRIEHLTEGRYDIQMASEIAISDSKVELFHLQTLSLSAMVKNCGELDFSGNLYVVLCDSKGNVIDTIVDNSLILLRSTHRTSLSVAYTPQRLLTPDVYTLRLCYRDNALQDGTIGNDNYTNIAQLEVYFVDKTVNAVSAFEMNSDSLFTEGEAQISVMAQNSGRGNFEGSFRLVLVNASLTGIVQELIVMEATGGLPHGGTAKVEFNGVITAPAGMYLLALQYSNGGDWSLAGSENHYNPVWVTVSEMQTGIDNPTASPAPKARKVIENGHVYIIVDDKKITLAGTRVK